MSDTSSDTSTEGRLSPVIFGNSKDGYTLNLIHSGQVFEDKYDEYPTTEQKNKFSRKAQKAIRSGNDEKYLKLAVAKAVVENELKHATKQRNDLQKTVLNLAMLLSDAREGGEIAKVQQLEAQLTELRAEFKPLRDLLSQLKDIQGSCTDPDTAAALLDILGGGQYNAITTSIDNRLRTPSPSKGLEGCMTGYGHPKFLSPANNLDVAMALVSSTVPENIRERTMVGGLSTNTARNLSTPVVHSTPRSNITSDSSDPSAYIDVGIHSLDDIMGSDKSDYGSTIFAIEEALKKVDLNSTSAVDKLLNLGKGLEIVVETDFSLAKRPVPGIIKACTVAGGNKGPNYDHTQRSPRGVFVLDAKSPDKNDDTPNRDRPGVLWKYNILYEATGNENNLACALLITGLPRDITLRDVLRRVRGGLVVTSQLCDTSNITPKGFMTAYIMFVEDDNALAFELYTREHPSALTFGMDNVQAQVARIRLPNYPVHPRLAELITKGGRSRIICVTSLHHQFYITQDDLAITIKTQSGEFVASYDHRHCVEAYVSKDEKLKQETLHIEFSSVRAAIDAYEYLAFSPFCTHFDFEDDSCAGPVIDLALPVAAPPPTHPTVRVPVKPKENYSGNIHSQVADEQRKRLTALNAPVPVIKSFSGKNLKGKAWADSDSDDDVFAPPISINQELTLRSACTALSRAVSEASRGNSPTRTRDQSTSPARSSPRKRSASPPPVPGTSPKGSKQRKLSLEDAFGNPIKPPPGVIARPKIFDYLKMEKHGLLSNTAEDHAISQKDAVRVSKAQLVHPRAQRKLDLEKLNPDEISLESGEEA